MHPNPNKFWYIGGGVLALLLTILSLGFGIYPQFPTMCVVLGIILSILIDTMEPIPAVKTYDWVSFWDDFWLQKNTAWRSLLFFHSKIIFPAIFTLYIVLLIIYKVKVFGSISQIFAYNVLENFHVMWVTLISAVVANFSGLSEDSYEATRVSKSGNALGLIVVCLLSFGGMWIIFVELARMGQIAYFVSLGVGILTGLIGLMIMTEDGVKLIQQND